jgi:uncharacterized coiled-coil protein SlyX
VARFGLDHGLSVDYHSARMDGGGTRWLVLGDIFSGQTISTWTGAFLSDGGMWVPNSDRTRKTGLAEIDPRSVLAGVMRLPITTWSYKAEDASIRHLGPMAQDFYSAFGIGYDDKHIGTLDESGVALAAIQGLNAKLEERVAEQEREIAELRERVSATESLRGELAALRSALAELQHPQASVAAK